MSGIDVRDCVSSGLGPICWRPRLQHLAERPPDTRTHLCSGQALLRRRSCQQFGARGSLIGQDLRALLQRRRQLPTSSVIQCQEVPPRPAPLPRPALLPAGPRALERRQRRRPSCLPPANIYSLTAPPINISSCPPPESRAMDSGSAISPEALALAARLFDSARCGDMTILEQALSAGLPPNLTNDKGDTLVSVSLRFPRFESGDGAHARALRLPAHAGRLPRTRRPGALPGASRRRPQPPQRSRPEPPRWCCLQEGRCRHRGNRPPLVPPRAGPSC